MKKRTLSREFVSKILGFNIITVLVLGVMFSAVVFDWLFPQKKADMRYYMESTQRQFTSCIRFLEEGVAFIRGNKELELLLRNGLAENSAQAQTQLEQGVNLFADGNLISGSYPIVQDFYLFDQELNFVSTHYYPGTQRGRSAMDSFFRDCVQDYVHQSQQFYYRQYGDVIAQFFALYNDNMETVGYCAAALEKNHIAQIFQPLQKYETYYWFLVDEEGDKVAGDWLPQWNLSQMQELSGTVKYGRKTYLYEAGMNSFGLKAYVLIPQDKLYLEIKPMFFMVWIIFLLSLLVLVLAVLVFSHRMTKPFKKITESIKQVGGGDFDTRLGAYEIQEFQDISDSFNEMIAKINQLIKEVYENQLLMKEARIQYIQAQLDPHFMFNILTMIGMRMKRNKDEELYRTVVSLAGLMRGKLFRKNEIEIPLEDEIETVEFYLYLQEQRFRDIIHYEIIWESNALKKCRIPRLCVQPLVENAIVHGLEPKGTEGHVWIEIKKAGETGLLISVEDDGKGFDLEEWKEKIPEKGKNPRVGIMNVQRLLLNLYGEGYGMKVQSVPGKGTRVELFLPLTMKNLI